MLLSFMMGAHLRSPRLMAIGLATLLLLPQAANAGEAIDASRLVTIGGAVTEIVEALGAADRIVGRDTTSSFPPAILSRPDVGYMRALSAEGLLSVRPTAILAIDGAGPPEALELVRAAGVPVVSIPDVFTADGVSKKVLAIGAALGLADSANDLAIRLAGEIETARTRTEAIPKHKRKRVMFVMSATGGRIMAAGRDTAAAAIIEFAGADNVFGDFAGYKLVNDEAVMLANPDVILMMDRQGAHALGDAELLALPAFATTSAARDSAVLRMDGLLLLGFGPRTAAAINTLGAALYPPSDDG